jgi:stringent starvation protein B
MTETSTTEMNSSRPYLMRAIYDWIVDNKLTPYLLVNAGEPDVQVPVEHINNGKIILNVDPNAVQDMDMSGTEVSFSARFSGKPTQVRTPISAVLAIYARENGRGMVFNDDDESPPDPAGEGDKPAMPSLRIVK